MCALVGVLIEWLYEMHGAMMKIDISRFTVRAKYFVCLYLHSEPTNAHWWRMIITVETKLGRFVTIIKVLLQEYQYIKKK